MIRFIACVIAAGLTELAITCPFHGFNRSFCGKHATMWGKGVYFARDASYSSCSTYAAPDENGFQYILVCRVVVVCMLRAAYVLCVDYGACMLCECCVYVL